jgi:galactosylceramidase
MLCGLALATGAALRADQTVTLDGGAGGRRFDGIGAVSGGGATSVLLKDYPEKQRSQVLDLLFKPKFGASMSSLLVEVPGDGNSTQGSEPSHMHTKGDANFSRGYEWWLLREAKRRNPDITLDACAWGCPGWVGSGTFWSQDMADYYASWIGGLKSAYGIDLDAIGCRNEKGVSEEFAKMLRATLNAKGLQKVKVHGFDNWGKTKFDWVPDLATDPALRDSIDAISNHTLLDVAAPESVRKLSDEMGKPIWDTEEHVYKEGFDCAISIVNAFNENYIGSGATKIVNWYLVGSTYRIEPYPETPAALIANTPWSGHYYVREALWGYAHYGQFTKAGWQYLNGACKRLRGGGTLVTLRSPDGNYSIIAETRGAAEAQAVTFKVAGGLSAGNLCVWRSSEAESFVRLSDVRPSNGEFTLILEADSIYSISTTTGQQKGSFPRHSGRHGLPVPLPGEFRDLCERREMGLPASLHGRHRRSFRGGGPAGRSWKMPAAGH